MPHSNRARSIAQRIAAREREKHDRIVRDIAHNGLSRKLPFFSNRTRIRQYWMEPCLTKEGIVTRPIAGDNIIATPDLLVVASEPDCLMGVEVKLNGSSGALRGMEEELARYRTYVEENGGAVYAFLKSQGFEEETIDSLAIRLCGVVGTRHGKGIRIEMFADLYNPEITWN
ncbi:MAG: hypothetical protein ABH864_05265 [archaeon]